MTLQERCQAGQAKLEQVSTALLDLNPEALERCEADLQEVIALLETQSSSGGVSAAATAARFADRAELSRLRYRGRLLALQAQQATNLCQGWAQLGLSAGYTEQGKPALSPSEPQSSFEA